MTGSTSVKTPEPGFPTGKVVQSKPMPRPSPAQRSKRKVTMAELEAKNGQDGEAWICVYNEVYDITDFLARHPGGNVLDLATGRDATIMYEQYHPSKSFPKVNAILENKLKHIGHLVEEEPIPDDTFFRVVRERVEKYLADRGQDRHSYEREFMIEAWLSVFLFMVTTLIAGFYGNWVAVILMGILSGRLGLLMHTANHCASSSSAQWNQVVGMFMDVAGGNSNVWKFEHNVAHHCYPNELGKDNDCEIGNPLIRFHPGLKHFPYQRFNAFVTIFGMTFGFMKWFLSDFVYVVTGVNGNVTFHAQPKYLKSLLVFKAVWLFFHFVIPTYYFGVWKAMGMIMLSWAIGGHYMENIFIVNHIQHGLVPNPKHHWATRQALATTNWQSGSVFWNHVSGGLNHQIEHHIFPTMNYRLYPHIAPIVQQTCKEFNVTYHNFPSFSSAWLAMFWYLDKLGASAKA